MRTLGFIRVFLIFGAFAAFAQTAAPPAKPRLTGFPFQDETLRYSIQWPSGISLGNAVFTAHRAAAGWNFGLSVTAGVPGFMLEDSYKSTSTADLCSVDFDRSLSHGAKKTREKLEFDQQKLNVVRETVLPEGGGKTTMETSACARDALAFVYFVRREMGQGRVAPAETVYFGGKYAVDLRYTGETKVETGKRSEVADHVVASMKGPGSNVTAEIDFARDAARTPLLIRVPVAVGTLSVELVR